MFSSQAYLDKKTGGDDLDRFHYLQALVTEYQDTDKSEHKLQILANMGNFAYDPINYEHFRKLNVLDLFLDVLADETDEKAIEFAMGGLCNCCADPTNRDYLIENDGIELAVKSLTSANEETVLSAITSLIYMHCPGTKEAISAQLIVDLMQQFAASENRPRLKNLASLFLKDCCGMEVTSSVGQPPK